MTPFLPSRTSARGIATLYQGSDEPHSFPGRTPGENKARTAARRRRARVTAWLGFGPFDRLPVSRIACFDRVAVQWLDVTKTRSAQSSPLRLSSQNNKIVRTRKVHITIDKPPFQVFLGTLLRVKSDRVEGAIVVVEGEGVFRILEVVVRLLHPLANPQKLLLRLRGHTGLVLPAPQAAGPIQSGRVLVRIPLG